MARQKPSEALQDRGVHHLPDQRGMEIGDRVLVFQRPARIACC
jgi:hypothetical protein